MIVRRTCSWCHTENYILLIGPTFCRWCRHRADLPRLQCDCPRCRPLRLPPAPGAGEPRKGA